MTATLDACREVLPFDAPRDEWLDARRLGIGGSDASTVADVNPWSSRWELYLDKRGELPSIDETPRMKAGRKLEPVMREWFTEETGIAVHRRGLLVSAEHDWLRFTPDGMTDDGGVFESKATNWRLADDWDNDQIADHAEVQAQHGMAVTGAPHAWVVGLIDGWDFRVRRVERDQALIDTLLAMERSFWFDNVLAGVEPVIDHKALDAVKAKYAHARPDDIPVQLRPGQIRPLITAHRIAKAAAKTADEQAKAAEAQIRALLGDATEGRVGDRTVVTCRPITRKSYTVAETTYRRLTIPKDNT